MEIWLASPTPSEPRCRACPLLLGRPLARELVVLCWCRREGLGRAEAVLLEGGEWRGVAGCGVPWENGRRSSARVVLGSPQEVFWKNKRIENTRMYRDRSVRQPGGGGQRSHGPVG